MSDFEKIYAFIVELEENLIKDLEKIKEWQRQVKERVNESLKLFGDACYGELEAVSRCLGEINAQLKIIQLIKKKIEEIK